MKIYKVLISLLTISGINTYGYKVHSYLGGLMEEHLRENEETLLLSIKELLKNETLAQASVWADRVKRQKNFLWTKELHYIDIMECRYDNYTYENIESYCNNKCIVSAIKTFADHLKGPEIFSSNIITRLETFKFLIHFLEDFNQPLHLLGYDRGGNSKKLIVNKNNRNYSTNLHFLWDTDLPEHFIKEQQQLFIKKVETKKTTKESKVKNVEVKEPEVKESDVMNLLMKILNDNAKLACRIYPDTNYIIFEEYYNKNDIKMLFDNYMELTLAIFKYIYNF